MITGYTHQNIAGSFYELSTRILLLPFMMRLLYRAWHTRSDGWVRMSLSMKYFVGDYKGQETYICTGL